MKVVNALLAPLEWFDLTTYDDGTPLRSDDPVDRDTRLLYWLTSLSVLILFVFLVFAFFTLFA